jgi:hypothetical protein
VALKEKNEKEKTEHSFCIGFCFDFVLPALASISVALAGVRVFCYCNILEDSLNGRRANRRHWE